MYFTSLIISLRHSQNQFYMVIFKDAVNANLTMKKGKKGKPNQHTKKLPKTLLYDLNTGEY